MGERVSIAIPSIVGRELKLDGELWTVVGVMPKELRDPRAHLDVGDASVSTQHAAARAGAYQLQVVGRMKPGVAD